LALGLRSLSSKKEDMIDIGKYHYMLFDGDCGICTSFSEFAKRIDIKKRFLIEPYQKFPEKILIPFGTSYEKCARRIHVIARSGRIYTGAFALNYFFFHYFPWSVLVVLAHIIPLLLLFEITGYAIVAKNRYHLSRWFGLKACMINHGSSNGLSTLS
jgi:predicted DCC family thiol-disulfide oxidoreductase YuxK